MDSPFEMVVWIVGISCLAGVLSTYLKNRGQVDNEVVRDLENSLDRIDSLEERVQVLERVITDDRHSLDEAIRGLDRE